MRVLSHPMGHGLFRKVQQDLSTQAIGTMTLQYRQPSTKSLLMIQGTRFNLR